MESPTRLDATEADAGPRDRPADARAGAQLRRAGLALGLACTVVAYRELIGFQPDASFAEELEQLLFIPSQTMAPLVVLLSAWLLYRRAGRLRRLPPGRAAPWLGGGLLALGALVHVWATLTRAPDLLAPSLALVGLGVAALWKGRPALRVVLLPAAFLIFAMPLPAPLLGEVVYRLQIATTDLTGVLLGALRVPHHVAGEQILRTRQTFSVIESCSGLRSIETLTMVAILMADLFRRPARHAWLLVLASPPVAFFLNGWRAVALILNPHSELASVHNLQGIAILLGGLTLLFGLDGALERVGRRRSRQDSTATPAAAPAADGGAGADPRRLGFAAVVLALLALASAALPRFPTPLPRPLDLSRWLEAGIGNASPLETDRVFLGSAGFRDSTTRRFLRDGHPVDVFVGMGWRAGRARTALSPKTAIPGSGWILEAEDRVVLEPDGREARSLRLRSGTQRLLVYHWYEGAQGLAAEVARSLAAFDASPLRRAGDIMAVRIATDVDPPVAAGLGPASDRLARFYGELRKVLDRVRIATQTARGKRFPDFPRWEELFLGSGVPRYSRVLENQGLGRPVRLGMPLATSKRGGGDGPPAPGT